LTGEDDVFAFDLGEAMHFDHAAAAHGMDVPLKGNDSPAIGSSLADYNLELAEQILRELSAGLA